MGNDIKNEDTQISATRYEFIFGMIFVGLMTSGFTLTLIKFGKINYYQIENMSIIVTFLTGLLSFLLMKKYK